MKNLSASITSRSCKAAKGSALPIASSSSPTDLQIRSIKSSNSMRYGAGQILECFKNLNDVYLSGCGVFQQPGKAFCCPPVRIREMISFVPFKAAGDTLCPDNGMKLPDAVPDGRHDQVPCFLLPFAQTQVDFLCQELPGSGIIRKSGKPDGRRDGSRTGEYVGL